MAALPAAGCSGCSEGIRHPRPLSDGWALHGSQSPHGQQRALRAASFESCSQPRRAQRDCPACGAVTTGDTARHPGAPGGCCPGRGDAAALATGRVGSLHPGCPWSRHSTASSNLDQHCPLKCPGKPSQKLSQPNWGTLNVVLHSGSVPIKCPGTI